MKKYRCKQCGKEFGLRKECRKHIIEDHSTPINVAKGQKATQATSSVTENMEAIKI